MLGTKWLLREQVLTQSSQKRGLARLTKAMSEAELNQAKETTTKYIEQYAK